MGRFIITEEEKNRIKLLYEVALPPSESILVSKKNPYNDKSIMDMVTDDNNKFITYNSNLIDGDTFIVLDKGLIQKFFTNVGYNFLKQSFEGKTIRFLKDKQDLTTTLGGENAFMFKTAYTYEPNNLYGVTKLGFQYPPITYNLLEDDIDTFVMDGFSGPYFTISEDTKNKLLPIFRANKDLFLLSKAPDEYFEIRKVQRVKTDFK
jgi:hypothetical protein